MRRSKHVLGAIALLLGTPAWAHFKITSPQEWVFTNALGDEQKTSPCGSGTASNAVLTVTAGQSVTIKWTETIGHSGHYRISLVGDRAQLVEPIPVLTQGGTNCSSSPILPAVLPVVVDDLFPTTTASVQDRQYDVTIPATPCPLCTIQVLEFMSNHSPPCFYHHCIDIQIVAADAGKADGGPDAGASDAGASDAGPGPDAGAPDAGAGPGTGGGTGAGGSGGAGGGAEGAGGCGCTQAPFATSLLMLGLARVRRRRRAPGQDGAVQIRSTE